MKKSVLGANVAAARARLEEAGFFTGGPTDRCHPFMMSCLTGAEVDFSATLLEQYEQEALERQHGMVRGRVHNLSQYARETLTVLFGQDKIPFEAVIISGVKEWRGRRGNHVMAAVADGNRPHTIVDSFAAGGFVECADVGQVAEYAEAGLLPDSIRFNLAWLITPEEAEGHNPNIYSTKDAYPHLSDHVIVQVPHMVSRQA